MSRLVLALLLAAGLFSSCGIGRRVAARYLAKHPDTLAAKCAEEFPCLPEPIRPGDTIRISDTAFLPGDSVPCVTAAGDTTRLPCPPRLVIHDTLSVHDTLPILDSARIRVLVAQKDSLSGVLTVTSADRDRLKSGRNTWRSIAIPALLVILVSLGTWIAIKFKLV